MSSQSGTQGTMENRSWVATGQASNSFRAASIWDCVARTRSLLLDSLSGVNPGNGLSLLVRTGGDGTPPAASTGSKEPHTLLSSAASPSTGAGTTTCTWQCGMCAKKCRTLAKKCVSHSESVANNTLCLLSVLVSMKPRRSIGGALLRVPPAAVLAETCSAATSTPLITCKLLHRGEAWDPMELSRAPSRTCCTKCISSKADRVRRRIHERTLTSRRLFRKLLHAVGCCSAWQRSATDVSVTCWFPDRSIFARYNGPFIDEGSLVRSGPMK
mmetsp:Transcript_31465/g.83842  ORF Transcript_31465/g.83842 Transcript_31465/m.83842 type:complete len:271 (+) Transcript_31465:1301-2113(+)